jgi:hypothetical protein
MLKDIIKREESFDILEKLFIPDYDFI